jgi:hypothetical protein
MTDRTCGPDVITPPSSDMNSTNYERSEVKTISPYTLNVSLEDRISTIMDYLGSLKMVMPLTDAYCVDEKRVTIDGNPDWKSVAGSVHTFDNVEEQKDQSDIKVATQRISRYIAKEAKKALYSRIKAIYVAKSKAPRPAELSRTQSDSIMLLGVAFIHHADAPEPYHEHIWALVEATWKVVDVKDKRPHEIDWIELAQFVFTGEESVDVKRMFEAPNLWYFDRAASGTPKEVSE